ncbi:MAG: hypothetical protein ABIH70_01470 [Chloroflexota bacterium]
MKMPTGLILIVIGAVALVISAICLPIGLNLVTRPKPLLQGNIAPVQVDTSSNFTINLGSNLLIMDYESLKNGINLDRFIHVEGFDYPIQIQVFSGRLSVSAWINDEKGNLVAHIVDNHWEVNPDNFFDRNFSNNAIEVVSKGLIGDKRVPALQVEIGQNNYMYIGGLFYFKTGKILITPKGYFLNPNDEIVQNSIEPLFEYPSAGHIGQRRTNSK